MSTTEKTATTAAEGTAKVAAAGRSSRRSRPRERHLGALLEGVAEGSSITRPDGTAHTSHGGRYLFDATGLHVVDGVEYRVK